MDLKHFVQLFSEGTYLGTLENSLNHMISQRLGGFSDELPDTASQMYKHFSQETVACLRLCYTYLEHSFVHSVNLSCVRFGVISNTVSNVKAGTIKLITAFIIS